LQIQGIYRRHEEGFMEEEASQPGRQRGYEEAESMKELG
jgi:hypothetical protein